MKKFMSLAIAAALMLAVAGQASAATLETSGEYRARFWYLDNYFVNEKAAEFWDQRLRLQMVWPVAEGVKLTARADILEGIWGDSLVTATTTAATATAPASTTYAATKNSRPAIDFDWLNLEFKVPNTPVLVRIGRQDASFGTGLFVRSDNRDRLRLEAKFGDTTAIYTFDKYIEVEKLHDTASLDDRRQHSAGVVTKVSGWTIGVLAAAIIDNATDPAIDLLLYGPDLYVAGKAGPVDLKFEAFYILGESDNTDNAKDFDIVNYAAYLGAAMPAGPVNLGFEAIIVSGDDLTTTDKKEGLLRADYNNSFSSIILFNQADLDGFKGESSFSTDNSVGNAWAVKLSGNWKTGKLTLGGALVYAARLEDTKDAKADPLGTEVDLTATYALTDNVNVMLGVGYLMAGDFYGDIEDPLGAACAATLKF